MKSEENYADLIRALNSTAIITETDAKGIIVFANDKFCEISGYSENELLGRTHKVVKSGLHRKDFFADMWKTISSGKVWFGEVCNRKKKWRFVLVERHRFSDT